MTSDLLGRIMAGMPPDFADPADGHRATREKMAPLHGHPLAEGTTVTGSSVDGVPVEWLSRPDGDPARGTVVFFHGGAFVSCDAMAYRFYAEYVADWVGVPVLTVDYRLAPEHRFPAALDDCLTVCAALPDHGVPPRRTVYLGDSCGGGLALAAAMAGRDRGGPVPAGVVSLSGWLDLDPAGYPEGDRPGPDPFITEGFLRARARDYLGPSGDPRDPRASPARGVLAGLPPLLLQAGQTDLCRRDAERLARRARRVGVDARVDVVPGGIHGVQGLVNLGVPEAVTAWESVRRFTDELLGP